MRRLPAGAGEVGYALHLRGAGAAVFCIHISLVLLIPGGLFEVAPPIWLLVKGLEPEAYQRWETPLKGMMGVAGEFVVLRGSA